jgi:hypothetical protein
MRFKNIGQLTVQLTKPEFDAGIFNQPMLSTGDIIFPNYLAPKNYNLLPNISGNLEREDAERLHRHMVKEPYVVVGANLYRAKIINTMDIRQWSFYDLPVYHFVKKRNYNKYIAQQLADNHRIDYLVAREQKVFDKSITLGLIEIVLK